MTEPKFPMVHQTDLYEETIIDGFAIYAFLSYSDCEESARQQDCLDDTEEDESVNDDRRAPATVSRSHSSGYNYRTKQRSRSGSRSSIGDLPNGSIYLENGKNTLFHRSVPRRKAGRPRGGYRRSKVQIKHEIFTNLDDPSIDAQQLTFLYNDYLKARFKEEEENKYKFTLPKSMDENFVNLALDALDSSLIVEKPSLKVEKIKKELENCIDDTSDDPGKEFAKIPETPEIDADLTEMISRHSKREIRLPARYHQSGLLMGSQWVIPEYGPEDKIAKKKIKVEETEDPKPNQTETPVRNQTSVIHHKQEPLQRQPLSQPQMQQIFACSLPSPPPPQQNQPSPQSMQKTILDPPPLLHKNSHFKPLYSCENQRIIFSTSNSSDLDRTNEDDKSISSDLFNESSVTNVDDLPNLSSPIKTCPSHVSQLKLHQEKLERLQLLRKQQEVCGKLRENTTVINNTSRDFTYQEANVDMLVDDVTPTDRSELNKMVPSSSPSSCESPGLNQPNSQNSSIVAAFQPNLNPHSSQSSSSSPTPMDNSDVQDQKSPRQQQLRQLYRDLYFENRPERRSIHAKNRIKPRVNKKLEVEEAIRVIEKLNRRHKQLEYIKKLLDMWNKKLELAVKVISDDNVSGKAVDIVADVLKTYQASKSYRVTEALDSLSKSKTTTITTTTTTTTTSTSSLIAISPCFTEASPLQSFQPLQPPQPLQSPQPPRPSQIPQLSRPALRCCSSVIKTTGSLSRIVMNPQAKANSIPESRISTMSIPVSTTTLTTTTSTSKIVDNLLSSEKTSGTTYINKISCPPPRIKAMVPLNQSQSSNQPLHHLHIHPSLPPPPPPSQSSFPITSLTRPPTQALPTLSTPIPNHAHLTPSVIPNIQNHSQANMKPIPVVMSPEAMNNLFSGSRDYGSRNKTTGDVQCHHSLCQMVIGNNVTPVNPVVNNSVGTSKPTIIKPTIFLTPNANANNSPLYRFLLSKGDLNRYLLTPQMSPSHFKSKPFHGPVLDPPEVSVQSDNESCN